MTTTLVVTVEIVQDETTDVAALLAEIDGQAGTLDVAGFRLDVTNVEVKKRPCLWYRPDPCNEEE